MQSPSKMRWQFKLPERHPIQLTLRCQVGSATIARRPIRFLLDSVLRLQLCAARLVWLCDPSLSVFLRVFCRRLRRDSPYFLRFFKCVKLQCLPLDPYCVPLTQNSNLPHPRRVTRPQRPWNFQISSAACDQCRKVLLFAPPAPVRIVFVLSSLRPAQSQPGNMMNRSGKFELRLLNGRFSPSKHARRLTIAKTEGGGCFLFMIGSGALECVRVRVELWIITSSRLAANCQRHGFSLCFWFQKRLFAVPGSGQAFRIQNPSKPIHSLNARNFKIMQSTNLGLGESSAKQSPCWTQSDNIS